MTDSQSRAHRTLIKLSNLAALIKYESWICCCRASSINMVFQCTGPLDWILKGEDGHGFTFTNMRETQISAHAQTSFSVDVIMLMVWISQLTLKHKINKAKKSPKVIIGFISEAVPDENVTPQCVWISDISLFLRNTGGLTWYSCLLLNLTPLKNNNLSTKAGWWLWSHNKRCFVSGHCKVCQG